MEAARNPWPALGALLVRDGAITAADLERALVKQREEGGRLGEILVRLGMASRTAVARVLAEQHELEFIELEESQIEPEAAGLLPENLARRYVAIPVRFNNDGSVLVAVADPTNVIFSDEIRLVLGTQIRVAVAAGDRIEQLISRLHAQTVEIEEVDEGAETEADATVLDLDAETPAVVFVNRTLSRAMDLGASDIHFTPQQRRLYVRARIDGVLRELTSIAGSHAPAVTSRLKIMGALDIAERRAPQDGRVSIRRGEDTVDLRVAVLPTTHGEKVTLRILNQGEAPSSLDALGMWPRSQERLDHAISQPYGCVLVVGPTGSGKTTTLYACLQQLNSPGVSVTTIEDPVEYRAAGLDQIEVNPRAGLTFASGLRTILRSDPDILLVGEIRDEETAQIAFRAAMTGHLVLSTLHAQTAASAMQRLLDMEIDAGIIATSLNAVVGQRLARRLCQECCEPYTPGEEEFAGLDVPQFFTDMQLFRAVGCPNCGDTGYKGRIGLYEVMQISDHIASLVGHPSRDIEEAATREGMFTMRDDGLRHCLAGITTLSEVRRVTGVGQ